MDPHQNQRGTGNQQNPRRDYPSPSNSTSGLSGPDPPDTHQPDCGNPAATDRQPRHSDGFTVIPPNESRRSQMQRMAQKEMEDLQRWKEANKVPCVNLNPERLGGDVSLAEARQKQYTDQCCSKLQKKLRKEELDKRRRQEEEEKLQKMKTEKRELAERLEERSRQEEQRRREKHRQDHLRKTESFLQSFESRGSGPLASSSATHTSSRSDALANKQRESKSVREVQQEHRRVNSVFLDKLEGRGRGSENETKGRGVREAEDPCFASEGFRDQSSNIPGQQLGLAYLDPEPEQSCSGWTEEADPEVDYDWALMKLINSFPDCARVFLEDILDQCNGDYEQAYTLLISTLS